MEIINSDSFPRAIAWRDVEHGKLVRFQASLAIRTHAGLAAFDGRYWAAETLDRLNAEVEVFPQGFTLTAGQK